MVGHLSADLETGDPLLVSIPAVADQTAGLFFFAPAPKPRASTSGRASVASLSLPLQTRVSYAWPASPVNQTLDHSSYMTSDAQIRGVKAHDTTLQRCWQSPVQTRAHAEPLKFETSNWRMAGRLCGNLFTRYAARLRLTCLLEGHSQIGCPDLSSNTGTRAVS